VSNIKTAELPRLGETLRKLRLERGLELADVAAELDIPAKSLRALEWDRKDLLGGNGVDELIERRYAAFLGLEVAAPAAAAEPAAAPEPAVGREPAAAAEAEAPRPSRGVSLSEWLAVLAALGPPLVIALPFLVEDVPLHTLGLVFLSSLLLFGAALPQGVLARARVSSASFARCREPLGLAALGILVPVALFSALGALT
jgi:transcriptional regulator with XRE-family HTH domain